jgi:hypothetical protein
MRNLIYPLIAVAVILACTFQAEKPVFQEQPEEIPAVQVIDRQPIEQADLSQWVANPSEVHLIAAQGAAIDGWESDNDRITKLEDAVKDLMKVKTSNFDLETRVDTLENQMAETKTDVSALSKRVDELAALIEVRCPDGKVKTAAVKLNSTGSGQFNLAPGEVLLSVDGVAVNSTSFSGGSNGTAVATTRTTTQYGSPPPSPTSGGSNGSLQYSTQSVNYQTSSYNVQSTPTPTTTNVQVQRRPLQQLRSTIAPRRNAPQSAPVCFGPNCPN